jgi:hypothetical protein
MQAVSRRAEAVQYGRQVKARSDLRYTNHLRMKNLVWVKRDLFAEAAPASGWCTSARLWISIKRSMSQVERSKSFAASGSIAHDTACGDSYQPLARSR